MTDLGMKLYTAWKNNQKEISLTLQEFNGILLSPHTGNEKISNYEHHAECPSLLHHIEYSTEYTKLSMGHCGTYL